MTYWLAKEFGWTPMQIEELTCQDVYGLVEASNEEARRIERESRMSKARKKWR